ncbi:hypothetical protein [Ferrimonas sp. YFM]|uniref:hypothetical protein n=1 Tax=Ferrimonas sp. YFM TaxID=3028878 RepID=UPI0025730CB4|nr:hypothetical protein [Ferrimonas sp. YFM]BDY03936.1 hypothetical protein F0521_09770 [Ferrimonas sp. YFM]
MIGRMFLLPIILSLLWYLYLTMNGYSLKQGQKGFYWIFGLSLGLIGFFALMIELTQPG